MGVTLGISIVTGLAAGFIASRSVFLPPVHYFDDREVFTFAKGVKYPKANNNEVVYTNDEPD